MKEAEQIDRVNPNLGNTIQAVGKMNRVMVFD
jgi:hypothetical protein